MLRTAVLGLGRIGWQEHIPSIIAHPGFTLAAVLDPLPERLEEARREFGVVGYANLDTLLAREQLDLVVIASPTHCHAEQAVAAMEHGVDVFCDKPMAPTLDDADRMIDTMARTGRKLMVFQPVRNNAETRAVRHILDQGLLGDLFMVKHAVTQYVRRNDWQALKQYGGGMLNNYGAHYVDQMLYLTGASPRRLTCALRSIASLGDADDVVKALFELDNGVLFDLDINMAAAMPAPAWQLFGSHGTATLAHGQSAFTVKYFRPDALESMTVDTGLAAAGRNYPGAGTIPWQTAELPLTDFPAPPYYDYCHAYFARGEAPFVPVAQTRQVMRMLEACRQDAGW